MFELRAEGGVKQLRQGKLSVRGTGKACVKTLEQGESSVFGGTESWLMSLELIGQEQKWWKMRLKKCQG